MDSIEKTIHLTPDDAFYYFKIALNFSNSGIFSFDNISATNGFQPLWQILIIPLFYFIKLTPEDYTKTILSVQLFICFVSIFLLILKLKKSFTRQTIILVFSFFSLKLIENYIQGMETCLLLFLYVVLFCYIYNNKNELPFIHIKYFIVGFLISLIVLARLDQIFLLLSFSIYLLIYNNNEWKSRFINILHLFAGFLPLFIAYILVNYIYFHEIMPVSGVLKYNFSFASLDLTDIYNKTDKVSLLCLLLSVGFILFYKKSRSGFVLHSVIFILSISTFLHFVYTSLFMKWGIYNWQFSIYYFVGLLILLECYEYLNKKLTNSIGRFIFIILLLIICFRGINEFCKRESVNYDNSCNVQSYKASQWAKQNTNKNDIFAINDSGIFSFFSERNVINLDGLVNNYEYQDILKNNQLNIYLKRNNVNYVVCFVKFFENDIFNRNYTDYNKQFKSFKYNIYSDVVTLKYINEVYRSNQYDDAGYKSVFLIWKF